ncbi:MAG: hypothetical protein V9G13_10595 [Marmoricola sp.]
MTTSPFVAQATFTADASRTFGIEIEFKSTRGAYEIAEVLTAAGIETISTGYTHALTAHSTPFGHLFHHHPAGDSTGIRPPVPRPCGRGSRSEATQAGHCYSAGVVDVKVRA